MYISFVAGRQLLSLQVCRTRVKRVSREQKGTPEACLGAAVGTGHWLLTEKSLKFGDNNKSYIDIANSVF